MSSPDSNRLPLRKTRRTWNEPGHAHFLTYSTYRRLPMLRAARLCDWALQSLGSLRDKQNVALWAYMIMPEHVHVLLCPRDAKYEMRHILTAIKKPVARAAHQHLIDTNQTDWLAKLHAKVGKRRVFRFWQPGGGFDHNVFRDRSVPAIMEYIHANPVRRELCKIPEDWAWSSARFWAGRADFHLQMDRPNDKMGGPS
ncbi:MAG: transposase [Phycisphaerae bacterium]